MRPRRWGRVCASAVALRVVRRGPFEAGGCACRRSGAVCYVPSFAVRSPLRMRPRRWGRVCASAVPLRVLLRGPFASSGQVVGWRRKRRWWRGGCLHPFPVPRAVETLGKSGCLGRCPVSSAARTRRGGRSSRWVGADASAGVRRFSPHGRCFTCDRGVAGCPARRPSRSVCRRAVSAVCAAEPSGRGGLRCFPAASLVRALVQSCIHSCGHCCWGRRCLTSPQCTVLFPRPGGCEAVVCILNVSLSWAGHMLRDLTPTVECHWSLWRE
ncbi:hypothetical protein BU14_0443s0001 [Porphyra umbilicalis]|uniref:Uncharacterized protein n=1 Tax=Porphyra umbilicalis TaxID=2786 RepID=A0A1X6NUV5_PORUM|nr:hypothetical protein BU14_0443s0001 [Porphyra umbilicalis]|eukprot:OSX72357.1 hypothetical protein BU14_0443s0001 [Porphyra umbilicalis]